MFNLITRMIKSPKNNVHTFVKVSLPAVDGEDTNGKWKAVVDPNISAQDILDTLLENWTEDEVKEHMFSRFIAVLADDPIRNNMIAFKQENPDATQDEIDAHSQAFADSGWNINLRHPESDRKVQSIKSNQTKATNVLKDADTEVQTRVAKQMLDANPELAKELAKLLK